MKIIPALIFFLVFPEYKEKIMEIARENMVKKGNLNEEQINQGMEMMKRFFWIGIVGGTLFFMLLIGLISSLIGAGIAKKSPNAPFQNPL